MRSQKGFTLVEMLVTTAIVGVIIIGVLASYEQVVSATMRNNRQSTALSDVSTAALEIHKDLFMGLTTNVPDDNVPVAVTDSQSVTFDWIDYVTTDWDGEGGWPPPPEEGTQHSVTYSMAGTMLTRNYDGVDIIVGRHVSYLAFTRNGADITVKITSTVAGPPEESETLEFTFHRRQGAQ